MVDVTIVAALCAKTGAIGFQNKLPWRDRLNIDMAFFRFVTTVPWSLSCAADGHHARAPKEAAPSTAPLEPYCATNRWRGIFDTDACFPHIECTLAFENLTCPPNPNNAIIMGRKTADSIPVALPLPGRVNVVLSKSLNDSENCHVPDSSISKDHNGILYCKDIQSVCRDLSRITALSNILVIGGSEIYSQFLKLGLVDHLLLTFVSLQTPSSFKGADVFFPSIPANYRFVANISYQAANALLEWIGTPQDTKRLLRHQIDTGLILKSGSIKESSGHLLNILWFQKMRC